jgi:hypothetical protein
MCCSSTTSISRLFFANMHAISTRAARTKGSANAYQRIRCVIDPSKPIAVTRVLGGLHVDYRRAA